MLCSRSQGVIVPIPISLFSLSLRVYFIFFLSSSAWSPHIQQLSPFQFSFQIIFGVEESGGWFQICLFRAYLNLGFVVAWTEPRNKGMFFCFWISALLGFWYFCCFCFWVGVHLLFYLLRSLWIGRGRLFWAWKIEVLGFVLKPWMNLTMAMGYLVCRNSWWLWLNSVKDWHCKNVVILCWGVIFGIFSFFSQKWITWRIGIMSIWVWIN